METQQKELKSQVDHIVSSLQVQVARQKFIFIFFAVCIKSSVYSLRNGEHHFELPSWQTSLFRNSYVCLDISNSWVMQLLSVVSTLLYFWCNGMHVCSLCAVF